MAIVVAVSSAVLAFVVDQASKQLVLARLDGSRRASRPSVGIVGMSRRAATLVLIIGVACVVVALVASHSNVIASGLGLSVGAGAANVLDLWRRGTVVDFITIGRWPTFNLADVALVIAPVLVLIGLVLR